MTNRKLSNAVRLTLVTAGAASTGLYSAASGAQAQLEEILVTGSRIVRQDFIANSPVSTLSAEQISAFGESTAVSGFLGLISAVVQIVVAFGLLGMKKWAWILALVGVGLNVVLGLVGIFSSGVFAFMCGTLGLFIPVLILIYLLLPGTRQAFNI